MNKILLVGLVGLAPLALLSCEQRTQAEQAEIVCNSKIRAYRESRDHAQERLRLPSSAEFPSSGVRVASHGDCRHTVYAYVIGENGFGGQVRMSYSATMRYDKSRPSWVLEDFQFQQ